MNCQDITRILDDSDIGSMTPDERGEVEAHLFACPDCAADWKIHRRLAAGFAPPPPAGLRERARAVVVAGEAGHERRASMRAILFGAMLGLAVAAAALGLKYVSQSSPDVPVATVAPAPEGSSPPAAAVSTEVAQEVIAGAPQGVEVLASETALRPATSPALTLFTVRIMPLDNGAAGAARDAGVDMFYRVLIEELRKVPGLRLLTPESVGDENDPVEHELRVSRVEVAPGRPQTMLRVEVQTRMRPSGGGFSGSSSMGMAIILNGPGDGPGQARHVVEQLRQGTFPPDPALRQQQLAILSNSAAEPGSRQQAMNNLLRFGMNGTADPATLRAAAEFATTAADPQVRESVWRSLQRMQSPDLIAAMTRSVGRELSAKVRLLLVSSLSRYYRVNAEVRAALESIAQGDPQQLLRMAAQRALGGEAAWNDYMITTLKNPQLTGTQRLEPLAYAFSGGGVDVRQLQLDDDSVRILGQIVIGAGAGSASADAQQAVTVLANLRTPVARDVLIDIVRSGAGKAESGLNLRTNAVRALDSGFRNDARAREVVDEVLASDSDPELRRSIEQLRNLLDRVPLRP